MFRFLVESALLTHGLRSVSNDTLLANWPAALSCIVWIDCGRIVIGSMEEYLPFRERAASLRRIDCDNLDDFLQEKSSGALTASGTMAVCHRLGINLAVTCGMGGIGDIHGEELCPDLPALRDIPVTLISTSPKDMLDIDATINWLRENSVTVMGHKENLCTGYLFRSANVPLDGVWQDGTPLPAGKLLLLNGIPSEQRVQDISLLSLGIAAGKEAEAKGEYYHPAANAAFDRLTGGASSRLQMDSLIINALWADQLTKLGRYSKSILE